MKEKRGEKPETPRPVESNNQEVPKYNIQDILYDSRQIMLYNVIDNDLAYKINRQLLALAEIDPKKPIAIWINSPGGYLVDGWSIIDTMRGIPCPIYTFICGHACSMAGVISIAGDKRVMTRNSVWMAHEMTTGGHDYAKKLWDRIDFHKTEEKKLKKFIIDNTKLTKEEVDKAWIGELWLNPNQCKRKGIVDYTTKR